MTDRPTLLDTIRLNATRIALVGWQAIEQAHLAGVSAVYGDGGGLVVEHLPDGTRFLLSGPGLSHRTPTTPDTSRAERQAALMGHGMMPESERSRP